MLKFIKKTRKQIPHKFSEGGAPRGPNFYHGSRSAGQMNTNLTTKYTNHTKVLTGNFPDCAASFWRDFSA